MRILVTGHKGFIGQNISKYLIQQGHEIEGWEWIPNTVPDPSSYDWVVHLGAITDTTCKDVEQIMEQNLEFSLRLLQVCDMTGTNFQYASSASVYGDLKTFNEEGPFYPMNPYAWSKYLFDRFVDQHIDGFTIKVQGFRFFNVYGNHEEHKGNMASVFHKFIKQARTTQNIQVFENSENYSRDFICVDDVCDIMSKFMDKDVMGVFNLGTGSATSFAEVAKYIARVYNSSIQEIPMPDNLKAQYQKFTQSNNNLLLSELGDYKFTSIYEWIDKNG